MKVSTGLVIVTLCVGACADPPPREASIAPPMEVAQSFRALIDSSLPKLRADLAQIGYQIEWAWKDSAGSARVEGRTPAEIAQQKYWATASFEISSADSSTKDLDQLLDLEFGSIRGAKWALLTSNGFAAQIQQSLEPRLDTRIPFAVERAVLAAFPLQVEIGTFAALREPRVGPETQ